MTTTTSTLAMDARPPLHLGPQPELRATAAEIDDRTGHVLVASLVLAHGVPMCEPEDLGYRLRVDQIVDVDLESHAKHLTCVSGRSLRT
jgi:hypothetical protein